MVCTSASMYIVLFFLASKSLYKQTDRQIYLHRLSLLPFSLSTCRSTERYIYRLGYIAEHIQTYIFLTLAPKRRYIYGGSDEVLLFLSSLIYPTPYTVKSLSLVRIVMSVLLSIFGLYVYTTQAPILVSGNYRPLFLYGTITIQLFLMCRLYPART